MRASSSHNDQAPLRTYFMFAEEVGWRKDGGRGCGGGTPDKIVRKPALNGEGVCVNNYHVCVWLLTPVHFGGNLPDVLSRITNDARDRRALVVEEM